MPPIAYGGQRQHTMATNSETDALEAQDHDPEEFYAEGVRVHSSGKVTIPSRHRDHYDIGHRDVLDVIVYGGAIPFAASDLPVDTTGRVRIPERKRRLYEIEDGDRVDIEVATTGLVMPDDDEEGE